MVTRKFSQKSLVWELKPFQVSMLYFAKIGLTRRKAAFERPQVHLETWQKKMNGRNALNLIAVVYVEHKLIMDVVNKSFSLFDLIPKDF